MVGGGRVADLVRLYHRVVNSDFCLWRGPHALPDDRPAPGVRVGFKNKVLQRRVSS